jgi:Holliday junction resolvase RusA-like endonuclease
MKKFQYTQFFPVRPKAKGRPRMTRSGYAYTPKDTKRYEKEIADLYKGPFFEDGMLKMSLRFTKEGTEMLIERLGLNKKVAQPVSRLTGDVDNYAKSLLDALNGVAYSDDKQIVVLYLEKA